MSNCMIQTFINWVFHQMYEEKKFTTNGYNKTDKMSSICDAECDT